MYNIHPLIHPTHIICLTGFALHPHRQTSSPTTLQWGSRGRATCRVDARHPRTDGAYSESSSAESGRGLRNRYKRGDAPAISSAPLTEDYPRESAKRCAASLRSCSLSRGLSSAMTSAGPACLGRVRGMAADDHDLAMGDRGRCRSLARFRWAALPCHDAHRDNTDSTSSQAGRVTTPSISAAALHSSLLCAPSFSLSAHVPVSKIYCATRLCLSIMPSPLCISRLWWPRAQTFL